MQAYWFFSIFVLLLSCNDNGKPIDSRSDTDKRSIQTGQANTPQPATADKNCSSDNDVESLGMGLVIAPRKFVIYNDSLLSDKFASKDMYAEQDSLSGICTKFFDPEYQIMHFVCIGQTAKAYKVLINYSQVKYLPKEKDYEYRSWENYILNAFGIRRLTLEEGGTDPEAGLLRTKPDDTSDELAIPAGFEMFCAMEMKGEWVKVKYDCFYNQEPNKYEGEPCHDYINKCKDPLSGWLRWRKGNKLLIDIMLMP